MQSAQRPRNDDVSRAVIGLFPENDRHTTAGQGRLIINLIIADEPDLPRRDAGDLPDFIDSIGCWLSLIHIAGANDNREIIFPAEVLD